MDDMSELDIELQNQTNNVSVTEIMEEIDFVQAALKEDNTPKHTEGELIDGK